MGEKTVIHPTSTIVNPSAQDRILSFNREALILPVKPDFARQLRQLPIAINALADPAILRDSTETKLNMLADDGHTGPVALITKGNLKTKWWQERLESWSKKLDLYIFASISGLPANYEPVPLNPRFDTLRIARDVGAKSIAYIRPIVPGINDSVENLNSLVQRAAEAGSHAVVSSGFRGTERIVNDSGFEGSKLGEWKDGWLPSVKLHTVNSEEIIRDACNRYGIQFWTGTSCAVAALSQSKRSYSPYHIASQFANCELCPIAESCYEQRNEMEPLQGSLDLLRYLGYQVDYLKGRDTSHKCSVKIRAECPKHCTNCSSSADFGHPTVILRRWNGDVPSWGDLSLARFITGGIICTNPDLSLTEVSSINLHPKFRLNDRGAGSLYATTSWMMWSEYLPKESCFKCSYCFVGMYKNNLPAPMQGTVGMSPVRIIELENDHFSH